MEQRMCKNCEYHHSKSGSGRCYYEMRKLGDRWGFATVYSDDFCRHWEPKWSDNPNIKEAWDEFAMTHKLITSGQGEK